VIVLPGSALRGLSLFLLAILVLRVAALYDETKWVGRCLWTLSGALYITTICIAVVNIFPLYSEYIPTGTGGNVVSNEPADKFVYEPLSRACLPVDVSYTPYAVFALPLIFDFAVVILTAVKVYRLAAALRKQSGFVIVRISPF
jgi:hypothetical protein